MLRNINIALRLGILISLSLILTGIVITSFYFGFKSIRNYYSTELQTKMFEYQKDKIKANTHSMAVSMSSVLEGTAKQQQIQVIRNIIDAVRYEPDSSGYFFVYKGTVNVAHPNHKYHDQDLSELKDVNNTYFIRDAYANTQKGGGFNYLIFDKPGKGDQPKIVYAEAIPNTEYWIATGIYLDNVQDAKDIIIKDVAALTKKLMLQISIGALLLVLIVVIPLSIAIRKSILDPINKAIKAAQSIASGNLNVSLNEKGRDEISILNKEINKMTGELKTVITDVRHSANLMLQSSALLNSTIGDLAEGSVYQASTAEEITAAMHSMEEKTRISSENAKLIVQYTVEIASETGTSNEVMQHAIELTKQITDKIEIVEEIARQTNMLAMNAAIEASRAGRAGAGFTVVANEVKKLADRSKAASVEINDLSVYSGEVITDAGTKLADLVPMIQKTATEMEKEGIRNLEQVTGIAEITKAIQEFETVIQRNVSASEHLKATAQNFADHAISLKKGISYFKF